MVTVSIGNGAERWEVKATDTAATMAALAGIVPPEPSLAVPSGMLTPLFQATLQAGLDALGCKSLLRFGEGTATAASPAAPVTAPAESSDDPGDDTAAKLEAKERELKLLRRELTQAKKLKRERLAKQAEFSEGRTEEMMIEENERLRVELEDVTEKAKELQKIKGELMTQAAEDKKTIRTLQGSAEDTKKKLQFQKKWVKNHADILKTMDSFAKMQGGNTFALADTPEINDKATKLYEARNKLLRARNAQLEVVLRERMTYVCCLGHLFASQLHHPCLFPFHLFWACVSHLCTDCFCRVSMHRPEVAHWKEEANLQAEEKLHMTKLHDQRLLDNEQLAKENRYLKKDQKDIRASIYKFDQRMHMLKKMNPDIFQALMEEPADPEWPTEEEYFKPHEVDTRKAAEADALNEDAETDTAAATPPEGAEAEADAAEAEPAAEEEKAAEDAPAE